MAMLWMDASSSDNIGMLVASKLSLRSYSFGHLVSRNTRSFNVGNWREGTGNYLLFVLRFKHSSWGHAWTNWMRSSSSSEIGNSMLIRLKPVTRLRTWKLIGYASISASLIDHLWMDSVTCRRVPLCVVELRAVKNSCNTSGVGIT